MSAETMASGQAAVETAWLIWSNEHFGWWGPNECGYVRTRNQAGRYSFDRAIEICQRANQYLDVQVPNETMCPDWEAK